MLLILVFLLLTLCGVVGKYTVRLTNEYIASAD